MSRPIAAIALAALLCAALSGCLTAESLTAESLATEAEQLRTDLAELEGVEVARLTYTEPVPLDTGKLDLVVRMPSDARPADVAAVITAAYAGFEGTHLHEEGDLDVRFGRHRIHLRSFEPAVPDSLVEAAALRAARATELGTVEARINTQEVLVEGQPHTTVTILLGQGSTARDVVPALAGVDRFVQGSPAEGWGVRAADGSELEDDDSLPSERLRRLFGQLEQHDLPGAHVVVEAGDYPSYPFEDMRAFVAVDLTVYARAGAIEPQDLATYTRTQTALVESLDPEILLSVMTDEEGTPPPPR